MTQKIKQAEVKRPREGTPPNFDRPEWLRQIKYDGYRGILIITRTDSYFISSSGRIMREFQPLADMIKRELKVKSAVLDGEIVVINPDTNYSDFIQLQKRARPPVYLAFDLISLNGEDIGAQMLDERLRKLERLVKDKRYVKLVPTLPQEPIEKLFITMVQAGYEGLVVKRRDLKYGSPEACYKLPSPLYHRARVKKPKRK